MSTPVLRNGVAVQVPRPGVDGEQPGPFAGPDAFRPTLGYAPKHRARGRSPEGLGVTGLISQPSGGAELASIRSGWTGPVLRPSGEAELTLLPLGNTGPSSVGVRQDKTRVPAIGRARPNG
jgi:hypothetical protein